MTNIIKKENGRPVAFGSVVDQLFRHNLNHWFNDEFWGFNGLPGNSSVSVNIRESDRTYELELVAPGLRKEDFQLQLSGESLTVAFQYEKDASANEQEQRWLRREYRKQSFSRTFTIDDTVDTDRASARYENGILYLTLPKKEQAQKVSRQISVQ